MVAIAAFCLLLFLANLRSRFYYHGPNYSFLFWIFLYCLLTGIGLVKLRKWGVVLLFIPGILAWALLAYGWTRGESIPMPGAIVNYCFLAVLVAIPAIMLLNWRELR